MKWSRVTEGLQCESVCVCVCLIYALAVLMLLISGSDVAHASVILKLMDVNQ